MALNNTMTHKYHGSASLDRNDSNTIPHREAVKRIRGFKSQSRILDRVNSQSIPNSVSVLDREKLNKTVSSGEMAYQNVTLANKVESTKHNRDKSVSII